jgi:hypothetical protein
MPTVESGDDRLLYVLTSDLLSLQTRPTVEHWRIRDQRSDRSTDPLEPDYRRDRNRDEAEPRKQEQKDTTVASSGFELYYELPSH